MANETLTTRIKKCIERALDNGETDFIIYPFGDIGMQVKNILKDCYNIEPSLIIDNHLCKHNNQIKPITYLDTISIDKYCIILSSANPKIYDDLKSAILVYIKETKLYEFRIQPPYNWTTSVGKYSYGPIACNHEFIEKIGNFCSFAAGVDVVRNHSMTCITTHPIIYHGQGHDNIQIDFDHYAYAPWYFEGIQPHPHNYSIKRITIGNDVWLGKNVTITNGSNIGNGVIAGAGAVITKDVPDYAVVVGVPAKIIRYRYTPEQIKALNTIQWWNWSDDEIRNRYDDFYLPIDKFIAKYF